MSLQAASAAAVDPRKITDELFAKHCVTTDIDMLVENWSPEQLAVLIESGRELLQQPSGRENTELCYAVAQACLRQKDQTSVALLEAKKLLDSPIRLVLAGFKIPIESDYGCMVLETLEIPRSAVSQQDMEMLDRLTSLKAICMDYHGEDYGTTVQAYDTPEEALEYGVTTETERLLIMLGRVEPDHRNELLSDDPVLVDKWRQYSQTMMSLAPWLPASRETISRVVDEDEELDYGARITLEDLPKCGLQTFIIRWYYHEGHEFTMFDSIEQDSPALASPFVCF